MGHKNVEVQNVPTLKDDPNYRRLYEGIRKQCFRSAFFARRNSLLLSLTGCWQLLVLYWAYIILRVTLRTLKNAGIDVRKLEGFTFAWIITPDLKVDAAEVLSDSNVPKVIMEILNNSNIFNDYLHAKRAGLRLAPSDPLPRFTLASAAVLPCSRLHDVHKGRYPPKPGSPPIDPKYVAFRDFLAQAKSQIKRAEIYSAWITSRSVDVMHAVAADEPIPFDWKQDIPFKARDRGMQRENADSIVRGGPQIAKMLRTKYMTWDQFLLLSDDICDWGSFKHQHLAWSLCRSGDVVIVGSDGKPLDHRQWNLPPGLVSDRATFEFAQRFVGDTTVDELPCSPAKRRKVAKPKAANASHYTYDDLFGFDGAVAGAQSHMKFVDRVVFSNRSAFNAGLVRVRWHGDRSSHAEVPLSDSILSNALDACFCMLANFCQMEKLAKQWLYKEES